MHSPLRIIWVLLPVALASAGCASNKDALQTQLNRMEREIVQLRASNLALQDRLEALEQAPSPEPELDERPKLDVVRLTPEDSSAVSLPPMDPADEGPRPLLRGEGDKAHIEEPSTESQTGAKPAVRRTRGAGLKGSRRN